MTENRDDLRAQAERLRDRLVADVDLIRRARKIDRLDVEDLDDDDPLFEAIDEFVTDGERPDEVERETWADLLATDAMDTVADGLEDRLRDDPLSVEPVIQVNVTLGTGGPACGVMFDCYLDDGTLELNSARVWWQEWFTAKEYVDLDDATAAYLFETWGCAYVMGS